MDLSPTPPSSARHRADGWSTRRRVAIVTAVVSVATTALATVLPAGARDRIGLGWVPWAQQSTVASAARPATTAANPAADGTATDGATPTAPAGTTTSTTTTSTTSRSGGPCVRKASAKPAVRITNVKVGVQVKGYGSERDTDPLPMAIAATPTGSWLAWLGTDNRVHLGRLDCNDRLVGKPTSFAAVDLQDVQADSKGGVLLLTRSGSCGGGPLCGGSSSPCRTMHMIRFNTSGKQVWSRQVTNLTSSRQGYDDGARFVWWYQHHGRLASDGTNYAAYFGVAITVQNGSCVDIHQGDRMQVVDSGGSLVTGHRDSFQVGCSHSWNTRIVWDPRTKHFVTVCATDNNCRIARPSPYRTIASGTCDGTLFGGDLVLAATKGYWTAWSQGGRVRLEHFTTGASDKTITTSAKAGHPHLVRYAKGRMLLTWQSGSSMAAQMYDAGSGKKLGGQFTIGVKDHAYQAFKAYSDGSVAYPAAGSSGTAVKVARVMPLTS